MSLNAINLDGHLKQHRGPVVRMSMTSWEQYKQAPRAMKAEIPFYIQWVVRTGRDSDQENTWEL